MRGSDLGNLFTPPAPRSPWRQGTIESFNAADGSNTVNVGGTVLTDLALLNIGDVVSLQVGDVVVVAQFGTSWAIIGRVIIPGGEALASSAVDFYGALADSSTAGGPGLSFTITSAFTTAAQLIVPTPSWANSGLFLAISTMVGSNTGGGSEILLLRTEVNGNMGGQAMQNFGIEIGTVTSAVSSELSPETGSPLGPTTTVRSRVRTNGATWIAGGLDCYLNVFATFRKV